ncbi:TetR/AcrR family transcriptional regulator [Microbacterium sorbitolivorans]|uniref:TetR family transcriptional regulator n=1 Tax=Microbacterium sorbitolivorans TaxID=1867410 RepID=A0A367Y7K8_9MICO|nr:TetR/AcrR family transcriptional regulator [Microbacterium sorbitolivorans]RCK61853.1 TetR family transcriptional regulator [Microbacterium sorbitolivorans]
MAIQTGKRGRPRAITSEMLAEAACELFLEQGYEATNVAEIAQRAGIARSSFFNYAPGKAELLWTALDERIRDADDRLPVRECVRALVDGFAPDALALAIANAEAMQIEDHLEREGALRMKRIADLAAAALRREGTDPLAARVLGGAYGAAVLAAISAWAASGAGSAPLEEHLERALGVLGGSSR